MPSAAIKGGSRQQPTPPQIGLASLALLYMVAATFWCLPDGFPGKRWIDSWVSPVFLRTGLWQSWDMFSPNPRAEDIYLSTRVFFADGTDQVYHLSRMTDYPLGQRYQRERWRKFFNDNFRLDAYRTLWPDGATWVYRRVLDRTGRPPVRVEFWRHWRPCVEPGQERPADFFQHRFYARDFLMED